MRSPSSRSAGDLVLGLATLVAAYLALQQSPVPDLVSRWWTAGVLATALLVRLPRPRLPVGAVGVLVGVLAAGTAAGVGAATALTVALATVVEALLVTWCLTCADPSRARLATWSDFRRFLLAAGAGCVGAAVTTAASYAVLGRPEPSLLVVWIFLTHLAAQVVVLPLFLTQPDPGLRVRVLEVVAHLALLAAGALLCLLATATQPLAFVMLPLLVWSAARFASRWAKLELVVVCTFLAWLSISGRGPFAPLPRDAGVMDLLATPQALVAVGAITVVAFMVATSSLRESLRLNRSHEVQLGRLMDSASGTAFVATDLEGTITWFSPGAEQLLGYRAQDVVGRCDPTRFHDTEELLARASELGVPSGPAVLTHALTEAGEGAEQDTREWTWVRRDGSRVSVASSVSRVRDQAGQHVGWLDVVRDVTDRRAAEQALRQALDLERETNRRMRDLDRAKSDFVSAVSHELRTPLTSIIGYAEILGDDLAENLTSTQLHLIGSIDRNGERLLALVEDLLTLARVEDGRLPLERVETDLRGPVRTATEVVSHAARSRRIDLSVRVPDRPVALRGDPCQLERLVLNLVSNAVKFTPQGGRVDVDLTVQDDPGHPDCQDGPTASVTVRDTGLGIPLEEQGRLFQRFFRSSLATEQAIQGTGLGLSIVQAIAVAHDGRVECESTPGSGSTFRLVVPLDGSDRGPAPEGDVDHGGLLATP
ncbi:ATP-binding protein [Nocardioides aurantiacus]|uniref:ATP-binding protein n=1 Tax=Nocardioides aurantiacus TaxID=86796 RepID=UPI00403F3A18